MHNHRRSFVAVRQGDAGAWSRADDDTGERRLRLRQCALGVGRAGSIETACLQRLHVRVGSARGLLGALPRERRIESGPCIGDELERLVERSRGLE